MNFSKYFIYLLVLVLTASCSTDFEINAPGKDITIVYGLLNTKDQTHYIKITKAFLGEQDALIMAKDSQNSTYGNSLSVVVEAWNNSNKVKTFTLSKTTIIDKIDGIFYNPNQVLYKFEDPSYFLNTNKGYKYKLVITNNELGKTITGETELVWDVILSYPLPGGQLNFINMDGVYINSSVKWKTAKNGRIYQPVFRFNYKEVINNQTDTAYKYVDWYIGESRSSDLSGGEQLALNYNGETFFQTLKANIPVNSDMKRYYQSEQIIFTVGTDELTIYIDVNKPSSSIVQERPAYTNITNGVGIFSSRLIKTFDDIKLSSSTIYQLHFNEYTKDLGFQ